MIPKPRNLIFLLLISMVVWIPAVSCSSSGKSMCERDRTFKSGSNLKNRSNYKVRYGMKARPVKKDYVIQNKKSKRRY